MASTKQTYKEKLLDPRWQKLRLEVFERDKFACARCGDTSSTLHVHHFCYAKSGNPWDSEAGDLQTLCANCHKVEHLKLTPLEADILTDVSLIAFFDNRQEWYREIIKKVISYYECQE